MSQAPRRTVAGLVGLWSLLVLVAGSVSWVAITSVGQDLGQALGTDGRVVAAPTQLPPAPGTSESDSGNASLTASASPQPSPTQAVPTPTVTRTQVLAPGPRPTVTVTTRVTIAAPAPTVPPEGGRATFTSRGGSLTVQCTSGIPYLVGTRPKPGWSVTWSKRNQRLYVRFRTSGDSVEVVTRCDGNQPARVS